MKLTRDEHRSFMPPEAWALLKEEVVGNSTIAEHERSRNKCIENFPWGAFHIKPEKIDLKAVKAEMDKHLYGLEKSKKQILKYLALLNQNPDAQIRPLLLVGAAGVGKSVVGKIIAKVINKPLKTVSMPSLSAGWQFTGTEKGWGNACPGIIVESILKKQELPVFLFDEVDKTARYSSQYSTPQQGLLNLLDDSRAEFTDVFFEVPINLNSAFFILTANDLSECNEYMADRCRVIEIEGYKDLEERRIILEDYILPKLFEECRLSDSNNSLSDEILDLILSESHDPHGGLRILQKQAENVALELVFQKQQQGSRKSVNTLLPVESVKSVLGELYQNKPEKTVRIGFGR